MTIVGIVALIIAVLFSIALHELGHMIPAKKFGVKVTQYMIGFGPTLWSRVKGDTEYGVKGIPLGGYIRMIGMYPPAKAGSTSRKPGRWALMIEQARQDSAAEIVEPGDEKRTFYSLSAPKKLVVMVGGPFMNLVLAAVLFAVVFAGFGTPSPTLTVSSVTACVPTAADPSGVCIEGEGTPTGAAAAGLRTGDEIVSWNGQPVTDWPALTAQIRAATGGTHEVVILRDGGQATLEVPLSTIDGALLGQEPGPRGFLGVSPEIALDPLPVSAVPGEMWDITVRSVQALATFPAKMVGVTQAAFTDAPRDPEGPVGVVGVSRISGEVAAADAPPSWRVAQFLAIVASLNLFLFLFNLLPILPLDGGHVVGALYEGARRQVARWRGQPDPGPVDVARMLPIAYGVATVLIAVSVVILWADLVKPIRLG